MNLDITHPDYSVPLGTIDISRILRFIPDKERLGLVKELVSGISEGGLIDQIRALVNDPSLDD